MARDGVEELRQATQRFFRAFGVLSSGSTPCGKPIAMAEAHALMLLLQRGEMSQQDLVQELRIDKSNVARLCAKLVEEGRATQRADTEDKRSRLVALTANGLKLAKEVDLSSRRRFAEVLSALPRGGAGVVVGALRDLTAAIEVTRAAEEITP
jgi:DNA-binding MarR family transcriptional regulator